MPSSVIAIAAAAITLIQPFHVKLTATDPDGRSVELMSTEGFADRSDCEHAAAAEQTAINQTQSQATGGAFDLSLTAECVVKDGHSI